MCMYLTVISMVTINAVCSLVKTEFMISVVNNFSLSAVIVLAPTTVLEKVDGTTEFNELVENVH